MLLYTSVFVTMFSYDCEIFAPDIFRIQHKKFDYEQFKCVLYGDALFSRPVSQIDPDRS